MAGITGTVKKGNPLLVDSFNDFLAEINESIITFDFSDRKDLNTKPSCFPLFNLSPSVDSYRKKLSRIFEQLKADIESEIQNDFQKVHKLFQLNLYRGEFQAAQTLLVKTDTGYRHEKFTIMGVQNSRIPCKKVYEVELQDYYQVMKEYADKCKVFLENTLDILKGSDEDTFRRKRSAEEEEADMDPFHFLTILYSNNGLPRLRKQFHINEEDVPGAVITYDEPTEVLTIKMLESGGDDENPWPEWVTVYNKAFVDYLNQYCYKEVEVMKSKLRNHIGNLESIQKAEKYFAMLLDRFDEYKQLINSDNTLRKYPVVANLPYELEGFIRLKYSRFFPVPAEQHLEQKFIIVQPDARPDPVQLSSSIVLSSEILVNPPAQITTNPVLFKWNSELSDELTRILFAELNDNFICDTPFDVFKNAFSGASLNNPLGIRWIDSRNNGQSNRSSLVYLFRGLYQANLLQGDYNKELNKKLAFIFVELDGQQLKNLNNAKNELKTAKTVTHRQKKLDAIIAKLTAAIISE
jgi:hypothetical protein